MVGSGWERMLSLAIVFTPGVAVSLLGSSHVKCTRYSYQLILAWLHALKVQAYNEYCQVGFGPHESMEMWEKRPHILHLSATGQYVQAFLLICCRFLWGQRMGDWRLTLSACEDLCPWFFAFGHTNYMRDGCLSSWKICQLCQKLTQVFTMLLWKESLQCNAVTRSFLRWHLTRARSTVSSF